MSTAKAVFQNYYRELVNSLPMGDTIFIAALFSKGLLPDDSKERVGLLATKAEKATFFLDRVIEPSVTTNTGNSFETLLDVMEDCGYQHVKELAKIIRTSLNNYDDNGSHSTNNILSQPASKSSPLDVSRLKAQCNDLLPTDNPKHKVMQFLRLALVEKEDTTLTEEDFHESSRSTLQDKKKKPLSDLREIFHYENEPCPRLILIMGGPGIGKTTMAHMICKKWAKDGFLAEDFDAIILIPMKYLQQCSLKDKIEAQVGEENYQLLEKSAGRRCLIILEGLDEIATDCRQNDPFLIGLITEHHKLQEARVLITSRLHACQDINAGRKIEVVGFEKDEIEKFVKHFFPNDIQIYENFLRQLDEYPQLHSLCHVPMNLVMMLEIYNKNKNELPSTLTRLYQQFIVLLLQRQVAKKKIECKSACSKVPVKVTENAETLSVIFRGIPKEQIVTVMCLSKLAYRSFFDWCHLRESKHNQERKCRDPKIIFTESDLNQCNIEVTSEFDGFGLLEDGPPQWLSADVKTYKFNHLAIQEFLCAVYISLQSEQEQLRLLREHFDECPNNIFPFVCGLTKSVSTEMFQFVYTKLTLPGEESGNGDLSVITALTCINEMDNPNQSCSRAPFVLNVTGRFLSPFNCLCLSKVLSIYSVLQLKMWGCWIGNKGAELLKKHYSKVRDTCKLLEEFQLGYNNFSTDGMVHVMKIVRINSATLRVLDISHNDIGDNGIYKMSQALKNNKSLTELKVVNCRITAKGAEYISKLPNITHTLQVLNMGDNKIGDDGMAEISEALQGNKSLTTLRVDRCGLSVNGAISISKMLSMTENCSLQELSVGGNKIGDDGFSAILKALGNYKVDKLSVSGCGITLPGASSLAAALSSDLTIRAVWLMNNLISVEGALLIVRSAVDNTTCARVEIDKKFKNDEIQKMMDTLKKRKEDSLQPQVIQSSVDKNDNSSCHGNKSKDLIDGPPITAEDETTLNKMSLLKVHQNDDTYSRGQEETRGHHSNGELSKKHT